MGQPKALLTIDGEPFVWRIASAMIAAGADPVVVITSRDSGDVAAALRTRTGNERILLADNPRPEDGQLSSLRIGLDTLEPHRCDGVLVCPVDVPLFTPATARAVVAAAHTHAGIGAIFRPEHAGAHGHPVLFTRAVFDELRAADLAHGARVVVRRQPGRVVDVPVDDPGAFVDIDTPDDYARCVPIRDGRTAGADSTMQASARVERSSPMPAPIIDTERLILDTLVPADTPALFAYRSHPDVSRYQNFAPHDQADAARFIADVAATPFDTPGTWFQFAIRTRHAHELIGDIGVHFFEDGHQAEIGFTLAPGRQDRGFATEAVSAVVEYLFTTLGKHRIIASVDPDNQPSIRLVRRLGLRQEGHCRQSLWFKGAWADELLFAILASEWAQQRPGSLRVEQDDVTRSEVVALLAEHMRDMRDTTPPESIHALDLDALRKPDVTCWSIWEGEHLMGFGALKELDRTHGEVKSMRTPFAQRRRGAGRAILAHIIDVARTRGYEHLSLETGSSDAFQPARWLYESFGFTTCGPFADYTLDPNSVFMTLELKSSSQ
jgi:putative acetyltransferase